MKNRISILIFLAFSAPAVFAQSNISPAPDCQKVFVWPIKADNERAKGAIMDTKRHIESALTKIKGCTLLDRDRVATLEEIAKSEKLIQHIEDASKKMKTALKTAEAKLVIFPSIEKAADGSLTINMSLEIIESTQVLFSDTWTLSKEESQESNLKASISARVYELVNQGRKAPPSLEESIKDDNEWEKIKNAKNDKRRVPKLCDYMEKNGQKNYGKQAEKWLDNIMVVELQKNKREGLYAASGLALGTGLFLWGNSMNGKAQDRYDNVYALVRDPYDPVYAGESREAVLKDVNQKRAGALTLEISGGLAFAFGVYYLAQRISWQKSLKDGKKTLGLSLVPLPHGVEGLAWQAPPALGLQVRF